MKPRLSPTPGRGATNPTTSRPYQRKGRVLRRLGPLAALLLSLVGVAAVPVVMFGVHKPQPAAQPAIVPPPSSARPNPAAPKAHAPHPDIVDRAFIDGSKEGGVPVPSHEYAMTHGHAVCDFLAHQPNFAEAVRFVQRSSVWDANQSADFAAGAIVSYRPKYEPANPDEMQPAFQNVSPVCKPSKVTCRASEMICKNHPRPPVIRVIATTTVSVLRVTNLRDQEVQEVQESS